MTAAPEHQPPLSTTTQPSRPDLHLVTAPGPATDTIPAITADTEPPATEDTPDQPRRPVQPQAPLHIQIGERLVGAAGRMPAVWSERPASLSERVAYSLSGDWTAGPSQGKRLAHLIGTMLALPVALVATFIAKAATEKPGAFWCLITVLFLLGKTLL